MSRVWWFLLLAVVFCILFSGIQAELTAAAEVVIENNLVDENQVEAVKHVVSENETITRKGAVQPRVLQETGRKAKTKKMLMRYTLALKVFLLGVGLPISVAMATFLAWKSITMSALAFGLAGIIGIKTLFNSIGSSKSSSSTSPPVTLIAVPQPAPIGGGGGGGWHSHDHKHQWHRDWTDESFLHHHPDRNGLDYAYRHHYHS